MTSEASDVHRLMKKVPDPFAYHRILLDADGIPVDYMFLDINPAFEIMTGLERDQILGRSATEIFSAIQQTSLKWIDTLGHVALNGTSIRFESRVDPPGEWYEITAFSFETGYFAAIYRNIAMTTEETNASKILLRQLQKNMTDPSHTPHYQGMTDDLLQLSGAKFVAINIYAEKGTKTVTRAISGANSAIRKASKIMGFELVGKAWDVIPERAQSIREGRLLRFDDLYQAGSGAISKWLASMLAKLFDIGEVYVVELSHEGQSIGDFILFMARGTTLANPTLIELYANQSGIIILRSRAERTLRRREEAFRTLAENSPDLITRVDRHCRRLYTNPAAESAFGIPRDELIGKTNHELGIERSLTARWENAIHQVFETGQAQPVEFSRRINGDTRYYTIRLVPEFDEAGEVVTVLSIARDITERKEQEEHIRWISFHDSTTGLYNRRFLEEEMNRLDTERQQPLSIIMADLNGLKLVNDAYGHAVGDEMLKGVANILKQALRAEDLLARWGGDEFLILLPKTPAEAVETVCSRIKALSDGVCVEPDIPISVTLGAATKTKGNQPLKALIQQAEDAMYRNKLVESKNQKNALIEGILKNLTDKRYLSQENLDQMRRNAINIGTAIGLSPRELERLDLAVDLHDIGNLTIPEDILFKKRGLTGEERRIVKKHPEAGYRILRSVDGMADVAEAILHHHERWDGTGYPMELEGDSIPLHSRIIAVVDAFDAMTHDRPYRRARSVSEALRELWEGAGSQFDPKLVRVFSGFFRETE